MDGFRGILSSMAIAAPLLGATPAMAADNRGIAGEYVCKSGCRLTDAPPSIAIEGTKARCISEIGGLFIGTALSKTAVACFNKTGALAADGNTVMWSNGDVWERRPQRPGQP